MIKFVLNNAKVPMVLECFKDFKMIELVSKRAINSKNPNATTLEVIITG